MATDCGDGDYLGAYRRFFEDFVAQVDPDDQLPVKVSTYDLTEAEISGEIIDWTLQYLNQKYCPPSLQSYLVRLVVEEVKLLCSKQPEACGCRFQENSFAPLKLMHTVTRKVNEICLRYLDNSRLALLPPPPSTPIPLVSRCAIKNSRRKMEDRYVVIHDLHTIFSIQDDSVGHYYAVFDGHAGLEAAVYCAAHLHQYLAESIHYPTDPERALRDAFLTTDAHFIEKSNKQNLNSGTTAVCALLLNKKLYIAWVGDSQAVLAKRGQITQLVNPHKPDRDDERERVYDMGGTVMHWGIWRVNGQLAVSRAIGDVQYKPYVTGDPDIRCIPLDGMEDFLIIACDGLWDYVSEAMATTLVYQQLREDPCDLEAVSQRLVFFARSQGSADNISAIVVFLTNPRQIATRHPSSHPLLADVQLNNMESTNPFLSNANGLQQFDANPFGKQQPTNGTSPDNDEKPHYRDDFEHPTNGKHSNGSGFDNNGDNGHGHNNDDDDDDDEDDDLGPETDVDAVDEGIGESVAAKSQANENLSRELFPEKIHDEQEIFETREDTAISKDQIAASQPPPETADQHALIPEADNVADSEDSEDEWNYYPIRDKERTEQSGEAAGERKENNEKVISRSTKCENEEIYDLIENNQLTEAAVDTGAGTGDSNIDQKVEQPELIDAEICAKQKLPAKELSAAELEEMDFQLNPNAAEFVPVSPPKILSTRANLNDDFLLSGSPQKQTPEMDDIQIPSQGEFQVEVSLRPHETENSNGKATEELPQTEFTDYLMDRQKSDNGIAAPGLDESEISSTKAEFGDESTTSFMTVTEFQRTGISVADDSFTDSDHVGYDITKDPMAMSFTPGDFQAAFEKEVDDLNVIHQLNDSDLIGDEDTSLANDEPFTALSPDLHPEATTLVTPDTDHLPPTTAFPDTRGEFGNEFIENSEGQSNPTSPEPLIENETSLMSGMVELIPSSCLLSSHATGIDCTTNDEEAKETIYRALDTSSPLVGGATPDKAYALSPEPVLNTFCGVSDKADIQSNISPVPSVALETETSASPASTAENVALEVASLLAEELSPLPQNPSPLPGAEIVEPGKISVEKATAGPDLFSFENSVPQESTLLTKVTIEGQSLDQNGFESHKEVYSPILDAELNVSQAMIDSVLDTPPVSHNQTSFKEEVNTSPDEQFKLVLDQTEINDSAAGIETEKVNILDESKSQESDKALVTLHQDKPSEKLPLSKNVFDMACPPFSTENFSRKDLRAEEISPLSSQLTSQVSMVPESKENLVETQIDSQVLTEPVLAEVTTIPTEKIAPEAEIKTLENLINEEPLISTPVMNLSESMQEFTGLEEQLQPEPQALVLNGLASHMGIYPEPQRPSQVDKPVDNLVEQEIAPIDTEVKPEITEKKEETKTEESSVVAPLAAATAVAAVAATAATVAVAASSPAKTTKTKPGVKVTPRTTTSTKTTNKSTPTSPTKAASTVQRATGTFVPKKPAAGTVSRPKQLETTKTTASSLTSKSPVAKSAATTKATTLNKTTVSRTGTLTASKPKPTSTTSRPAAPASSADKKPTTNGDTKPLSRPATAKPAARSSLGTTTAASKTSTKTSTTTRTASGTTTAASLRSRPAPAATATTKPKVAATTGTTSTTAISRPKSSPAPAPRDTKPRSTLTKSPVTDKQTKETTNKQLSSARTTGSTLTKSSGRPSSTGTTTLAKRTLAGKNVPPVAAPQPQKKPAPITRPGGKLSSLKNATKTTITSTTTKTTEVQVVQNGVSEVHQQKTVISSSNVEEDVPQKDVSPITSSTDNQLIMTAD